MSLDEHGDELHGALAGVVPGGEERGRRRGRVVHLCGGGLDSEAALRGGAAPAPLEHGDPEGVEDGDEAVDQRPHLGPLLGREVVQHELLDGHSVGLGKVVLSERRVDNDERYHSDSGMKIEVRDGK